MATNNPRPVSYIGAKLPCPRSTENNVDWCSGDLSLGLESGFGERISRSVVDVGGSGLGPRVYDSMGTAANASYPFCQLFCTAIRRNTLHI